MKRKGSFLLLIVMAAVISQTSCTTFAAPGMFLPNNSDLKDALGSRWFSFEAGGVVEKAPPLLIRFGLGITGESNHESNPLADITAEADYITLRAAAMYLVPSTGERKTDGLYFGGGMSVYSWVSEVKGTILGIPFEVTDDCNDVGILLLTGYRHRAGGGDIGFFGEVMYEYVKSTSDTLDAQLGEQLGGFSIIFGIFF